MPEIQLVQLIYIVSLLAASLATFGVGGLVPGVIVSVFWGAVFASPSRRHALVTCFILSILGCGCVGLLSTLISSAGPVAYRGAVPTTSSKSGWLCTITTMCTSVSRQPVSPMRTASQYTVGVC